MPTVEWQRGDSSSSTRAARWSRCLSHSHMCHEHHGGQSGVPRRPSSSVWTCLKSTLVLVHACGAVHCPRGGAAVLTDFLPDSDCPVELRLSKIDRSCVEGSRLSNYHCVGGNPEFTSDSSRLVSRLEYWSSAPFGRGLVFQNCAFSKLHLDGTLCWIRSMFAYYPWTLTSLWILAPWYQTPLAYKSQLALLPQYGQNWGIIFLCVFMKAYEHVIVQWCPAKPVCGVVRV